MDTGTIWNPIYDYKGNIIGEICWITLEQTTAQAGNMCSRWKSL